MKRIAIDSYIGGWFGITSKDVENQINAAEDGEDIEIVINSPGGDVYEGIAIFNAIREAAKTHTVTVRINGICASMASYIALAARTVKPAAKIVASENSIYVIHNPWGIEIGDYREFKKQGNYLEKLASVLGSVYAAVTKKAEKEIRDKMDEETYYVGQEVLDCGFANEFEHITENTGESASISDAAHRDTLIINAKLAMNAAIEKVKEKADLKSLEKAVALLAPESNMEPTAGAIPPKNNNTAKAEQEAGMNPKDLKEKYPDVYAAVFEEGKTAGVEQERSRVAAHLKMGETAGNLAVSAKFIREGKALQSDEVLAEYQAIAMKKAMLGARASDDPGDTGGAGDGGDGDDEIVAAMDKELGFEKGAA